MKITINEKDYNLKLTTRGMVELESALNANPLSIISNWDEDNLPSYSHLALFMHAMIKQLNHGVSLTDTYDLMDAYMAEGNNIYNLIPVILNVLQECGFIPKANEENSKN